MIKTARVWSWLITFLTASFCFNSLPAAPAPKLPAASERWKDFDQAEVPSFRRHIIPMFSHNGCSGRECHGSFSGRGGFQLSLFGYDFDKDHKEITDDQEDGVRIDREHPDQSLIILKPTNQEHHKGKERFAKGSWEYNMLLKWITAGAKNDAKETGEFGHLEVIPHEIVFHKTGESIQLKVLAYWQDGTVEDVTEITRFRTNDESVSSVSDKGVVSSLGPGDTHIVAFYDNGVLPIPVMQPVSDLIGSKYPKIATHTKVDELIVNKLHKIGIVPSELCTDSEFLRRVSLDLTGTLPAPDDIRKFLADTSPNKRQTKIDELIQTPAYAAWWTTKLCDFTGNNAKNLRSGNNVFPAEFSQQWYEWIYERVAKNKPYDELAAGIIMGTSRTRPDQSFDDFSKEMSSYFKKDHPTDFAERDTMPYYWARRNIRKPEEKALAFSHTFLGVRIECSQCHKHPFDQWTKTDFQQFQAFFEPIRYASNASKSDSAEYRKLMDDIKESIGITGKGDGKDRKKVEAEIKRRAEAGEPVPWEEVFVVNQPPKQLNAKQLARLKQKDPNYSSRVLTPKILGGDEVTLNQYPDPRKPLLDWLRDKKNPYFARCFVNRVWANYFGRGIVEPADDMNLANPPVNEALMTYLAEGFVNHGYDMRWLHKEILNSDTYQRSWKTNPTNRLDEKNFSHMVVRRLPAEIAMDAIEMATASSKDVNSYLTNVEKRAIGIYANSYNNRKGDYALKIFGKPVRETNCDCERTEDPTLLQTIYMRNDPDFLSQLENKRNNAWMDELRRTYGADKSTVEKLTASLRNVEKGADKLKQRMAADTKNEAKYQKMMAKYDAQKEKIEKQIADKKAEKDFSKDRNQIIADIFLRTVSRPPNSTELAQAEKDIAASSDPLDGVRDLLWTMLNTREFLVNH